MFSMQRRWWLSLAYCVILFSLRLVFIVASDELSCNTTTDFSALLSNNLVFRDCAALNLSNIPSHNISLTFINCTLSSWTFESPNQLSFLTVRFYKSVVHQGLLLSMDEPNAVFRNVSIEVDSTLVKLDTELLRVMSITRNTISNVTVTIRSSTLNVVCPLSFPDSEANANAGIVRMQSNGEGTIEHFCATVSDTVVSSKCESNVSGDTFIKTKLGAVLFLFDSGYVSKTDALRNFSCTVVNCIIDTVSSTRSGVVVFDGFGLSSDVAVIVLHTKLNFNVAGPLQQSWLYRQCRVLDFLAMSLTAIVRNVSSTVALATGTTLPTVNGSHVLGVDAAIIRAAIFYDSTAAISVTNCSLDVTIVKSSFSNYVGKIQTSIVSVLLNFTMFVQDSFHIDVEINSCHLDFRLSFPLCPFERRLVWFEPPEGNTLVRAMNLSGVVIPVCAVLLSLSTPLGSAAVSVHNSTVKAIVANTSSCPAVSPVAVVTIFGENTNLSIPFTYNSRQVVAVCAVMVVDEKTAASLAVYSVTDNADLILIVAGGEAPRSNAINNLRLNVSNVSLDLDRTQCPLFRNVELEARALVTLFGAEVSESTITITGGAPFSPLFYFGRGTVTSLHLDAASPLPVWQQTMTGVLNDLNLITIQAASISHSTFAVDGSGVLALPSATGGLVIVQNSTMEAGVVFNLSHVNVSQVPSPPVFVLVNARLWNTIADDTQFNMYCVVWNGYVIARNASPIALGVPSRTAHILPSLERGCYDVELAAERRVTIKGAEAASVIASLMLQSVASVASHNPFSLIASQGISFATCDDVSFGGPADGNYFSLAVGVGDENVKLARGTVVGAVVFLIVVASCVVGAALIMSWRGLALSFTQGLDVLSFPGCLYGTAPWILMPSFAASVALSTSPSNGADIIVPIVGFLGLVFCIGCVTERVLIHFAATDSRPPKQSTDRHERIWHVVFWLTEPSMSWVNKHRGSLFVERYGKLFDGYDRKRHWYSVVDLASTSLSGLLQGLAFSSSPETCRTLGGAFGAVEVVAAVASVVLWPMIARLDKGVSVAFAVLPFVNGIALVLMAGGLCSSNSCEAVAQVSGEMQLYGSIALMAMLFVVRLLSSVARLNHGGLPAVALLMRLAKPEFFSVAQTGALRVPRSLDVRPPVRSVRFGAQNDVLYQIVSTICSERRSGISPS